MTLLAPIVAPPSRMTVDGSMAPRGTHARCGKAIRRDLWHMRLVTLITGIWPGGGRR
jgi:hypothetical protein